MSPPFLDRLSRVRPALAARGLDALLVTHPPNLRYLTGFDGSMGALVVEEDRCTLLVDGRYVTAARARLAASGLADTRLVLVEGSHEVGIASVLGSLAGRRIGFEAAAVTVSRFERVRAEVERGAADAGCSPAVLVATEGVVEDARLVKDATEVHTLRSAARMLSDVARRILAAVRPGCTELDLAAEVDRELRTAGFERAAFDTIVASGPNSALPHARPGPRVLEAGDPVVLDFGGVHDGYSVDLTRTVQLAPATSAFAGLYEAVRAAHAAAIAAVAPGVLASAVDGAARHVLAEHGLGDAFLHGTGHGLGLEVHERPRISRPGIGADEVLVPGMVFTIEPGVYVEGIGGVRLEDDVLVVDDGCEVLTHVPL